MSAPLVELVRGDLVDAIHRGDLAVVSADGECRFWVGDPQRKLAYWRSAAKPFQSLPVIASGVALSPEDIALTASSHGGEPVHVAQAASLLERIGHRPDDLECGARMPLDAEAARALERRGVEPTALHNPCSGKHAGMLALADALGVPFAGYRLPEHPVQRAMLERVARFTDLQPRQVMLGLDGCGVPCFGISVYRMALAYARLMAYDEAAPVRDAMMAHPYLVAGRARMETDLMEALPGAIVGKVGADGIQCIGLPGGLGIAVKIEDGTGPAADIAALETLRQLGVLGKPLPEALMGYARPLLRSVAGERAGEARVVFQLEGR